MILQENRHAFSLDRSSLACPTSNRKMSLLMLVSRFVVAFAFFRVAVQISTCLLGEVEFLSPWCSRIAGKSTLFDRIVGVCRMLVCDR